MKRRAGSLGSICLSVIQERKDLVLTVAVVNVAGPDKKRLIEGFKPDDEERLKKLIGLRTDSNRLHGKSTVKMPAQKRWDFKLDEAANP